MKILGTINCEAFLTGKDLYLDNDFLNFIYKNADALKDCYPFLSSACPILDPLITFEFVRTIFLKKEIEVRRKFLSNSLFYPATNHQQHFLKIQENALQLSQIYAHKKQGTHASMIDLLLAARVIFFRSKNPYLITGNKSDFPICVFNTLDTIHWENPQNGNVVSFCILEFDKSKFELCLQEIQSANSS